MKYRNTSYFNENDTYLFRDSTGREFKSKVHFEKGNWWTNESLQYKAITLKCKKL